MDMIFGLDAQLASWLKEDIGSGDITTNAIVGPERTTTGIIHAKDTGVLAGVEVAEHVFRLLDADIEFTASVFPCLCKMNFVPGAIQIRTRN